MKSMMHTTPAVALKLWDYAMNYVEATSAVKAARIGHLRHAIILQNFERTRRPGRVHHRLQRGAVGVGESGHALACVVGLGRCGC